MTATLTFGDLRSFVLARLVKAFSRLFDKILKRSLIQ
jgi:hypothetical protein